MGIDVDQVPAWMQGVGSILALILASVAVVVAGRTFRIESERDQVNAERRQKQDLFERRSQAALISAWWGQSQSGEFGIFVRNASEAPVYQLYATILSADDRDGGTGAKVQHLVVPPAPEATFYPHSSDTAVRQSVVRRVDLTFTDASGVRWQRNQHGRLAELAPHVTVLADEMRSQALSNFKDDFRDTYGVSVSFDSETLSRGHAELTEELAGMHAVDAVVFPHDRIGHLIERDAISSILLAEHHRAAFPPWALRALTVDGRLYGIPTTMDIAALIRNTDLVPDPPETFEQLMETGLALRADGTVTEALACRIGTVGDPFQVWPLFTGAGGWLFASAADGTWDSSRIGLTMPESIEALTRIREIGEAGSGLLRRTMDKAEAFDLFCSGRTPFLISTSDAMIPVRAAGVPVAVSAVPGFVGTSHERTFTAVHGLMVAKHGRNRVTALDLFADYLAHEDVMDALRRHVIAPVCTHSVSGDPAIAQYTALCDTGRPMPSFPYMAETWNILARMELSTIAGGDPHQIATVAAREIERLYRG